MNNIKRIIQYAFNNFIRNGFVSLATIIVISIIVFVFNVTISIGRTSNAVLAEINKKVDIIVNVKEDADSVLLDIMTNDLKAMDEVIGVEFVSKEEAFEKFKQNHPEKAAFLEKYDLNPLPAQIQIKTRSPLDHESIISFLGAKRFRDIVETENLKRKVYFISVLSNSADLEKILLKIKDSDDIENAQLLEKEEAKNALLMIFENNENEVESFIKEKKIKDLRVLKIESEYPGKNLKAQEFLESGAFSKDFDLIRELKDQEPTDTKNLTKKVSEWIISFTEAVQKTRVWSLAAIIICGLIIIVNAIQISISMRKKEIEIMRLVGAKFSFIRAPFLLEGGIYGFLSALLSITVFAFILSFLNLERSHEILFLEKEDLKNALFLGNIVLWEILTCTIFGIFAAWLATLRYLDFSRKS